MRGRGRGRGRTARGRRGTTSRGRTKKKVIESDDEETVSQSETQSEDVVTTEEAPVTTAPEDFDMECADISQLEAPTFTTINRGPPEPMLHLRWDHKVSLIGEKVLNPMIHCCDKCHKPILIYARMIPCKHVSCVGCANSKNCLRCMDSVSRVEQAALGTVFMCTHGGSRYGEPGCGRTYLSQRDLQAHINHRHTGGGATGGDTSPRVGPATAAVLQRKQHPPAHHVQAAVPTTTSDQRCDLYRGSGGRTNLITVPIQQEVVAPSLSHPPPVPTSQPPPLPPPPPPIPPPPPPPPPAGHYQGGTSAYPTPPPGGFTSTGYSPGYYNTPPPVVPGYPPPGGGGFSAPPPRPPPGGPPSGPPPSGPVPSGPPPGGPAPGQIGACYWGAPVYYPPR